MGSLTARDYFYIRMWQKNVFMWVHGLEGNVKDLEFLGGLIQAFIREDLKMICLKAKERMSGLTGEGMRVNGRRVE